MRNMRKLLAPLVCFAVSLTAGDVTHIHLHVVNDHGKPVGNAEVIVKFLESRVLKVKKKESWEVRTSQEGMASFPAIPQGKILIQINAKNYQTFGESYEVYEDEKTVEIELKPPQPQYSADPSPTPIKK